jgi:5-methylcytosine-specific restriction protein A
MLRAFAFGGVVTRLKTLGSSLNQMRVGLAVVSSSPAQQSRDRDARLEWRAWYKTARWQRLRWSVLVAAQFTCKFCGWTALTKEQNALLVADHRHPHRGDASLFWDVENLQCLCKPCHDRDKQRTERSGSGG